jgi:hypothetical protein
MSSARPEQIERFNATHSNLQDKTFAMVFETEKIPVD